MNDFNPPKLEYNFKDFIGIYENVFTKKECINAINLFELYHKSGYTYSRTNNILNDTSVNIEPSLNLDWNTDFIDSFHDRFYNYIYPIYNIQYSILQQQRKHILRYIKIQKTCPTQGYHIWHYENEGGHSNDRILNWILYLNDIEEGGETEFLYQSLRVKPKQGTFILFPAYFTHTHRGNPPLKECKYIATGWIEFACTNEKQGASKFPDLSLKSKTKNINYQ